MGQVKECTCGAHAAAIAEPEQQFTSSGPAAPGLGAPALAPLFGCSPTFPSFGPDPIPSAKSNINTTATTALPKTNPILEPPSQGQVKNSSSAATSGFYLFGAPGFVPPGTAASPFTGAVSSFPTPGFSLPTTGCPSNSMSYPCTFGRVQPANANDSFTFKSSSLSGNGFNSNNPFKFGSGLTSSQPEKTILTPFTFKSEGHETNLFSKPFRSVNEAVAVNQHKCEKCGHAPESSYTPEPDTNRLSFEEQRWQWQSCHSQLPGLNAVTHDEASKESSRGFVPFIPVMTLTFIPNINGTTSSTAVPWMTVPSMNKGFAANMHTCAECSHAKESTPATTWGPIGPVMMLPMIPTPNGTASAVQWMPAPGPSANWSVPKYTGTSTQAFPSI